MFDLRTFTIIHTVISLIALAAGIAALLGMAQKRPAAGLSTIAIFLLVVTSVTGFGFPFVKFLPSHAVGIISLLVLAAVIVARYVKQLSGGWLAAYAVGLAVSVYLDAFVAVVQAFLKVPALHALAPTQKELPFVLAQGATLAVFVVLGFLALRGSSSVSALKQPA
jgi:hypothetical protein